MARGKGVGVRFYGDWDGSGVKKAEREIDSAFTRIKKSSLAIGAGFAAGFVGVQALTNGLRDSIAEAQEAIKVNAATAQIIKSTGGAAKVTADQVADLSQRISEQIAVDDELIQQSANLILTFKNIRNEGEGVAAIFDRTVIAAQDLSAAGFGDVESAAKMLGKALNDPAKGLTALGRAGVTFSQEQKNLIKTLVEGGDVLGAQKVILAEVESQVGGVAGATATGIDKFNVYFANLKEELGLAILPFVNALISGLLPAIKGVSSAVQGSSRFIEENKGVIIGATAAVISLTAAMAINRIGGIAFAAQYAIHTITVSAYTAATKLAATATATLTAALKAVPFMAIVAAVTGFVMALEDAATEQENFRKATEGSRRSIDKLKDSTGEYTAEARYLLATNRYSHLAQDRVSKAISGTAASAVAAGEAMGRTLTPETYDAADAADTAAKSYLELWEAIWNTRRAASDLANTSGTVTSALAAGARTGGVREYWENLTVAYGETEKAAGGVSKATKEATEAQKKFEDRLKEGRETLQKAIESAKEYAENIRTSFVDALDLGAALDAAKETGNSIVEEFIKQGERMAKFSENVRKLVAAGLERPAFDAIIRAGSQRGADIAAALVDGNVAENARRVNDVYRSVNNMGIEVGRQAAPVFESAGILTAQSMLERMIREFMPAGRKRRQLLGSIDEMVGEALRNLGRMTGFSVSGGAPSGGGSQSALASNPPTFVDTTGQQDIAVPPGSIPTGTGHGSWWNPISNQLEYFAKGGIVTSPTLGVVGEAGPEAIIPLRRAGGLGTTINLTVNAGMGTDGAEVGRQIVDALRQYQRRNGPVPISVA